MTSPPKIWTFLFIILGVYIVGSYFKQLIFNRNEPEYNIGCYVNSQAHNQTEKLENRLSSIQQRQNQVKINTEQQRIIRYNDSNFHNKSVQLAISFEKYLKNVIYDAGENQENRFILSEISKAEKEYASCKKQIDQSFSERQCKDNWIEYEKCFSQINGVRQKITTHSKEQKAMQEQISQLIRKPIPSISSFESAKRRYQVDMERNQQKKKELELNLEILEKNLKNFLYNLSENSEKYQLSIKNYQDCQLSKKKHHACEQISKQVRNINNENINYLKTMLESKGQLLNNLQRIINSQKNSKEMEEYNDKYNKHREEYKIMFKEFISLTRENQKACGCTSQKEDQLRKEMKSLLDANILITKQISNTKSKIEEVNRKIQQSNEEREGAIRVYKLSLEKLENSPIQPQSKLNKVSKKLQENYGEILKLKYSYKAIEEKCDKIKRRMGQRVRDINKINECLNKKDYFLKLKSQTVNYIERDTQLSKLAQNKKQLLNFLDSFGSL